MTSRHLLLAILIIALIILSPVLIIWSLNILFPVLAIPYTWKTLIAAFLLGSLVGARAKN